MSTCDGAFDARRPFLTHNAEMWDTFEPGLRPRMAEAGQCRSTSEEVEEALFELLPSGRSGMKDVARQLGIGSRDAPAAPGVGEHGMTTGQIHETRRHAVRSHPDFGPLMADTKSIDDVDAASYDAVCVAGRGGPLVTLKDDRKLIEALSELAS